MVGIALGVNFLMVGSNQILVEYQYQYQPLILVRRIEAMREHPNNPEKSLWKHVCVVFFLWKHVRFKLV